MMTNTNLLVMGKKRTYMNIFCLDHSSSWKRVSSFLIVRFCREDAKSSFSIFMGKYQCKPVLWQCIEWIREFNRRRKTKRSNNNDKRAHIVLNSFLGKFFAKMFSRKRPSWYQLRLTYEMLNYLHTDMFSMLNLVRLPDTRRLKIHIQIRKGKPWRTDGAEFSIKV